MLVIVAAMSVVYVRRMVRIGEVDMTHRTLRRAGWNILGLAVFAVMVFPVFWMISSAFKPTDELNSVTPTWFSGSPTLRHFRAVLHRPYFWTDVKNSLIVVVATVAIALVLAFLAAIALAKYRFTRPQALHRARDRDPDAAAGRADHSALHVCSRDTTR